MYRDGTRWHSAIDAIAHGVEAKYDELYQISKIITQETVSIAKELNIPEAEIQKWVAAREITIDDNDKEIKSSLAKLVSKPIGQVIFGMAVPHQFVQNSAIEQN